MRTESFRLFTEQHFIFPDGKAAVFLQTPVTYGQRFVDIRPEGVADLIRKYQERGALWMEVLRVPNPPRDIVELAWAVSADFSPTYLWDEAQMLIEAGYRFASELGLEIVPDWSYDFVAYGPGEPLPRTDGFTIMKDDGTGRATYLSFVVQGEQGSPYCIRAKSYVAMSLIRKMHERWKGGEK